MAVQDADNAALKGIHTYINETHKKERIWKVVFVILMLLYIFNVSWLCRERSAPVNFKEGNLEFSRIRVVAEDGSMQTITLDAASGEKLKLQIQDFLREEMPDSETMGRLEVLPRESAREIYVNLEGLVTIYKGVYYDQKSYEYYTFPDIGRIHQMLCNMCINQLTEGGNSN